MLGVSIALGFHYRVAIVLFLLGFTYVELIDKATYLNHYYLVSLLCLLMAVAPAHRSWSIDAWLRPSIASRTAPAWTLNLLRLQLALVYLFAGLAKVNADWLLAAQPLRIWLAARSDLPFIGPIVTLHGMAYAFSWFGAAYDLAIVWFLLQRRTRAVAYATVVVFHAMTWVLFPIGMFPAIMIVATLLFFPPDWPRWWIRERGADAAPGGAKSTPTPAATLGLLTLYVAVQIALPLRGYWPGADPDWTGRGFNFGWRVMIAEKAGLTELTVVDPVTGRQRAVPVREYLTERQEKMMAQDPDMIRALARQVAADCRARGEGRVEVRADAFAALNGRPLQRLIDPRADLAAVPSTPWIVPRDPGQ